MNVLRYVLEAAYFISLLDLTKSKNIMHRLKKYKSKINGFTFMLNVYISREYTCGLLHRVVDIRSVVDLTKLYPLIIFQVGRSRIKNVLS